MEYEVYLLEAVNYNLMFYSPFESLEGLRLLLKLSPEYIKEKVEQLIYKSYTTDALLLFPPGIIAVAALFLANKESINTLGLSSEQKNKVEEAAEVIKSNKDFTKAKIGEANGKFKLFAKKCPEFAAYMEDSRK